jgi:hypothetical protein
VYCKRRERTGHDGSTKLEAERLSLGSVEGGDVLGVTGGEKGGDTTERVWEGLGGHSGSGEESRKLSGGDGVSREERLWNQLGSEELDELEHGRTATELTGSQRQYRGMPRCFKQKGGVEKASREERENEGKLADGGLHSRPRRESQLGRRFWLSILEMYSWPETYGERGSQGQRTLVVGRERSYLSPRCSMTFVSYAIRVISQVEQVHTPDP